MSERVRVILLFDERLPEAVRAELGGLLEAAGWASAADDDTCFVCRAAADDSEKLERRVRKSIEFAAFTADQTGTFPFMLQIGQAEPVALSVCVGAGKTQHVSKRNSGLDFTTERVPRRQNLLPRELTITQMKTAF